jgi:serine/threonine-protein kinase
MAPRQDTDWPTQVADAPTRVDERATRTGAPVPPPVDPRRRALDDVWPWLFALALLVIAALVALWWFRYHDRGHRHRATTTPVTQPTFPATTIAAPKVATPKLVGLTQTEAAARLARLGLTGTARPVKSLAAAGTVTAQKPSPGTRLKKGSQVVLNVARGKPAAAVPDVSGQTAPAAVAALRKAGFLTVVVGVPSTQAKGTVVAESPPAGTKAQAGSKVRLNISQGKPQQATTPAPTSTAQTTTAARATTTTTTTATPAPKPAATAVTVPNVASLAQSPAIQTLEQAWLHAQVNLVQGSQPAGRVISQQPAAQSKSTRGQVVQLNVSLGPNPAGDMTEVPDVTNQPAQQATQTLQHAGFRVEKVYRRVGGAAQAGKVVDEQPSGQAPQGWKITLVVGRFS